VKKIVLLTGILILSLRSVAQEFKESDLDRLLILHGKVNTYYSKGCETKAKYLQELVQDAVIFFENKLQDTFDIKLLVLNRRDWKLLVGGSYLLQHFNKDPDRIEMGSRINQLYKIKLPENGSLYGKHEAYFWDFVAVHELGHYISQHNKIKGISWTKEFFADYIMIGFLLEKIPDFKMPSSDSMFFRYMPLKYKSLKDFRNKSSKIDPLNLTEISYQTKFEELAFRIFKKRGWNFMFDYIDRFTFTKSPPPEKNHLEFTITEFQKMEPEIFNEWLDGMRKTYHPLLVLFTLIVIIGTIRLIDNSYNIFTSQGLLIKKRYKIFGIPTLSIISKLKSVESLKIKRKLKLIMGLRPIMYLCLFLLILLLILHH
jgi:hypothetical protein